MGLKNSALVVDDNELNLLVASGFLVNQGIETDTAGGAREAVGKIKLKDYDIIFMDHMMPEIDGIEATKMIRNLGEKQKKLPIIALTANTGNKDIFISAGLNDFLAKPIEKNALLEILTKWLPSYSENSAAPSAEIETASTDTPLVGLARKIDGLDVNLGLGYCDSSQDVYTRCIKILNKNIPEICTELMDFLEDDEIEKFTIGIHGLKGSLSNIGHMPLAEKAKDMEMAAKENNFRFCLFNFPPFRKEITAFNSQLTEILSAGNANASALPQGSDETLREKLTEIIDALDFFDTVKADDALKSLRSFSFKPEILQKLQELSDSIDAFDFDLSATIAKELL